MNPKKPSFNPEQEPAKKKQRTGTGVSNAIFQLKNWKCNEKNDPKIYNLVLEEMKKFMPSAQLYVLNYTIKCCPEGWFLFFINFLICDESCFDKNGNLLAEEERKEGRWVSIEIICPVTRKIQMQISRSSTLKGLSVNKVESYEVNPANVTHPDDIKKYEFRRINGLKFKLSNPNMIERLFGREDLVNAIQKISEAVVGLRDSAKFLSLSLHPSLSLCGDQPSEEVIRTVENHVRHNEYYQNARDISFLIQDN